MGDIDFLEHGGGNAMVRLDGALVPLQDPRALHYQAVLGCLTLKHAPGTPGGIPEWQRALVFDRWSAAWDLPDFDHARRLAYLVDQYRSAIASDLQTYAGVDLGALWRERRWTHLLDLIDHLPAHSWYSATVAMDEEYAKMMAEAIMRRRQEDPDGEKQDSSPSLNTWTPEVATLTRLVDAVNSVRHAVIATAAGDKAPPPPKPEPRPITPLERALKRAEFARKKAAHETLAARVLRHKRESQPPVH